MSPLKFVSRHAALHTIPFVALDCEMTGLDLRKDRIISVAAIELHGARVAEEWALQTYLDPEMKIPAASQAIHGIADADVAGSPRFAEIGDNLHALGQRCVWLGHGIDFDLAMMKRECRLAGLAWKEPAALDLASLTMMLHRELRDLRLDSIAHHLGVEVTGRHTAAGDAMIVAGIWLKLLPSLQRSGVSSAAELFRMAEEGRHLQRARRAAGWHL